MVTSQAGIATLLDPVDCDQRSTVNIGDLAVVRSVGEEGVLAIELFAGEVRRIVDGEPAGITDTSLLGAGAASFDVVGDRWWIAYEAGRELTAVDGAFGLSARDPIPLDGRPFRRRRR